MRSIRKRREFVNCERRRNENKATNYRTFPSLSHSLKLKYSPLTCLFFQYVCNIRMWILIFKVNLFFCIHLWLLLKTVFFLYFLQVNNNFLSVGNANKEINVNKLLIVSSLSIQNSFLLVGWCSDYVWKF